MNNEIFYAIISIIIFLMILCVFDDGSLLLLYGIFLIFISYHLSAIFELEDLYRTFQLIIGLIAVLAIAKSIFQANELRRDQK